MFGQRALGLYDRLGRSWIRSCNFNPHSLTALILVIYEMRRTFRGNWVLSKKIVEKERHECAGGKLTTENQKRGGRRIILRCQRFVASGERWGVCLASLNIESELVVPEHGVVDIVRNKE